MHDMFVWKLLGEMLWGSRECCWCSSKNFKRCLYSLQTDCHLFLFCNLSRFISHFIWKEEFYRALYRSL